MTAALIAAAGLFAAIVMSAHAFSRRIEARHPPAGEVVDVGACRIHCVETPASGRERGVVLLVHGASGNFADLNEALAARLSAIGFRVVSVDRPGHGWSERLAPRREATSPERQADWIREALERRGVKHAVVVVHSLAGVLGLSMALNAPEFTRGLVLIAPVSHPWGGGVTWYYTVAAAPIVGPLFNWLVVPWAAQVYLRRGVKSVFSPQPTPQDYAERTRLKLLLRPWHFRANAEDVVDIEAHVNRLHAHYSEISVPTAVVTGDRDGVVYTHIHSLGCARDILGATLTMLEGVGHSPHYAEPDAVVAAISEVFQRAQTMGGERREPVESVSL